MSLIDRVGALAGVGAAIHILFLPGCICDLWLPKAEAQTGTDFAPGVASAVVAKAFAANSGSARVHGYLGLIAVFLLIMFFSRLYGSLRDVSGPRSWLPIMALAGGVLMAGALLFEIGLTFARTEIGSYTDETEVVNFFVIWGWNSANLLAPPFAMALASSTLVAWAAKAFPRWYRRASGALLVLLVIASGMGTPGLAIAPGMVWMFLTSFVLAIGPKGRAAETAT